MKITKILKGLVLSIVAGMITETVLSSVFIKREFSLYPTVAIMVAVFLKEFKIEIFKKVLLSILVYFLIYLVELKLRITLVSIPIIFASSTIFLNFTNFKGKNEEILAVTNFPRVERINSEKELREKIKQLKNESICLEVKLNFNNFSLVKSLLKDKKFVAYKDENVTKVIFEGSEDLLNSSLKENYEKDTNVDPDQLIKEILKVSSPRHSSFIILLSNGKKITIPGSYSHGNLEILDTKDLVDIEGTRKINEKNGWLMVKEKSLTNYIKRKIFRKKLTFSFEECKEKVDLKILRVKNLGKNNSTKLILTEEIFNPNNQGKCFAILVDEFGEKFEIEGE